LQDCFIEQKEGPSILAVPLPTLLNEFQVVLHNLPQDMEGLIDEFITLTTQVADTELEAYKIDKSTNFDLNTEEGIYNHQLAGLYFGVVETGIEYLSTIGKYDRTRDELMEWEISQDKWELITKLLERHFQLRTAVKAATKEAAADGTKGKGKGKAKAAGGKKKVAAAAAVASDSAEFVCFG